MATARCYTKSGNVEKYESAYFSGGVNHYPHNFTHNIIGPDSNGNYTITYEGYDDANSSNYDCYCKTIYGDFRNGGGISKTFYFKKRKTRITFRLSNLTSGARGTVTCSISGPLPTDVSFNVENASGFGFTLYGDKTNPGRGFFDIFWTSRYPSHYPKVGEQWHVAVVRPNPIGADLGDFEYVADTTYFTIKY